MTIDIRQILYYNRQKYNKGEEKMKTCQTCGKILKDSMEEFRVNGILQCEDCAYPNNKKTVDSDVSEMSGAVPAHVEESKNISSGWSNILKSVCSINLAVGIICSIISAVVAYRLIFDDYAFLVSIVVLGVGVVLTLASSALCMLFAQMSDDIAMIRYITVEKDNDKRNKK